MAFAWVVECKTCMQRFAVGRREVVSGQKLQKPTPAEELGDFECPHCHDIHDYTTDDRIPAEGKV